jgi:hypothetical protein
MKKRKGLKTKKEEGKTENRQKHRKTGKTKPT